MKVYQDYKEIKGKIKNPVLTIGNFDGVHKGHQHIFKCIISKAKEINGEDVVMTFDPHPLTLDLSDTSYRQESRLSKRAD